MWALIMPSTLGCSLEQATFPPWGGTWRTRSRMRSGVRRSTRGRRGWAVSGGLWGSRCMTVSDSEGSASRRSTDSLSRRAPCSPTPHLTCGPCRTAHLSRPDGSGEPSYRSHEDWYPTLSLLLESCGNCRGEHVARDGFAGEHPGLLFEDAHQQLQRLHGLAAAHLRLAPQRPAGGAAGPLPARPACLRIAGTEATAARRPLALRAPH